MQLYQEELLDHYRNPRHKGRLVQPHFKSGQHNPSCGDSVCFEGKFENGFLVEIAFDGVGCVISQAAASLLAEHVKEKPLEFIVALNAQTITVLIGMDLGPTRLKCALLSLYALQEGVAAYCAQVANDAQ